MQINNTQNRHRQQRGFSLVEVLIALVIMSVGMLGIAGLYVQSMQAGRTSMFRHAAVTLASDVADRIRANPMAAADYENDGVDRGCVGSDCNQTEMAEHDIFLWQAQADGTLPNGDVDVDFDNSVNPPLYTITISWDEPGENLSYIVAIPVRGI